LIFKTIKSGVARPFPVSSRLSAPWLTPDDAIEELVRLYRRAPERQRAGVLSVVRAMLGTAKALPLVLAALVM